MTSIVEQRARRIYAYLTNPMNTPRRLSDICRALGLNNSETTHRAIRKAAEYASEDGFCLPCAEPREGGPVYVVTDEPAAVLDSTIWLAKIAVGAGIISDDQAEWIRSTHLRGMTEADRAAFLAVEAIREADAAQRKAQQAALDAVAVARKVARASS